LIKHKPGNLIQLGIENDANLKRDDKSSFNSSSIVTSYISDEEGKTEKKNSGYSGTAI
jgi:hypothetical protein